MLDGAAKTNGTHEDIFRIKKPIVTNEKDKSERPDSGNIVIQMIRNAMSKIKYFSHI